MSCTPTFHISHWTNSSSIHKCHFSISNTTFETQPNIAIDDLTQHAFAVLGKNGEIPGAREHTCSNNGFKLQYFCLKNCKVIVKTF